MMIRKKNIERNNRMNIVEKRKRYNKEWYRKKRWKIKKVKIEEELYNKNVMLKSKKRYK